MSKAVLVTKPSRATNVVVGTDINPSTSGSSVTFTVMVAPASYKSSPPTGTVTLLIDATPQVLTLTDGVATYSTSALSAGDHTFSATYPATYPFLGSTSFIATQHVNSSFTTAWAPTGPKTANASLITKWYSDVTSVTGWGAGVLVGDGVTDNTPLLDAMIRGVSNTPTAKGGECFYFPVAGGGNYAFNTMLLAMGGSLHVVNGIDFLVGIQASGTGYALNDVLTLSLGTFGTAAQIKVTGVNGSGGVTVATVQTAGSYTVAPANPVSTTGGGGSGCTLTVVFACVDGSQLSGYQFIGDLGSDGNPASRLFTTLANAILVQGNTGTSTFQHTNLIFEASGSGSTDVYINSTTGQRISKCEFRGYNGVFCTRLGGSFAGSIRDCRFMGTAGFSNIGLAASGPTVLEVNNCLFDSWTWGQTIDGTGSCIKDTTFNFCATGLGVGVTNTGAGGSASRSYFENLTFTNNNTAISAQNSGVLVYHNITITGSSNTPAGPTTDSVYGINASNLVASSFDRITTSGPFSTAAVNIAQSSNTTFYSCTINNYSWVNNGSDPHTGSPAKWRVAISMTGIPAGDRTNFVFGTVSNTSLQASAVAQPALICDETARRVTVAPESIIVDMTSVGLVGNNNAGNATSNTTNWRTFITNHAGQAVIMYFPQGKYLINGQIDLSSIPVWEIRGDGTDCSAGQNGTRIQFTGTPTSPALKADYAPTGCGQFHIRDINLSTNQASGSLTAFYGRNVAMSSIKNCQFVGTIGLQLINAFKCNVATLELVSNQLGIYAENCYGCSFENPDNNSGLGGYRIAGGKNNAFFSARVETVVNGFRIGTDLNGNSLRTDNLSLCGMSLEACDFGITFQSCLNLYCASIGIHCTNGSPAGHSKTAYWMQAVNTGTFLSCTNDGSCSNISGGTSDGWSWYITNPSDLLAFIDCTGANSSPSGNGIFDNLSSGSVTQLACSF